MGGHEGRVGGDVPLLADPHNNVFILGLYFSFPLWLKGLARGLQHLFYYKACELDKKTASTQTAILLHAAGPAVQDVFSAFPWAEGEDQNNYATVVSKLTNYCEPRKNVVFERYKFWSRDQRKGETFDTWLTDLRNAAVKCEFVEETEMIRDKVVFGIQDMTLKERLLRESELSLQKVMDICRAAETSRQQVRDMSAFAGAEAEFPAVNYIHGATGHSGRQHHNAKPRDRRSVNKHGGAHGHNGSNGGSQSCQYCGNHHARGQCPAYGKQCTSCLSYNHFSSVCRGGRKNKQRPNFPKKIHTLADVAEAVSDSANNSTTPSSHSQSSSLFVGKIGTNDNKWDESLIINDVPVLFKLDTGAEANILPSAVSNRLAIGLTWLHS